MVNVAKSKSSVLGHNGTTTVALTCPSPLVVTNDTNLWYNTTKNCALPCKDPIFHQDERDNLTYIIFWLAIVSFSLAFVSLYLSWLIKIKSTMSRVFWYYHLCLWLMSFGWLLQFLTSKSQLACNLNNTIIYGLTLPGPVHCMMSFFLTYYMTLVAMIWFTYYCYLSYKEVIKEEKPGDKIPQQVSLFAWSVPFIMSIYIAFTNHIDGNSLYGICFVGQRNPIFRLVLYNLPLTLSLVGVYYLSHVYVHRQLKRKQLGKDDPSKKSVKREENLGVGLILLMTLVTLHVFSTNLVWIYEYLNKNEWYRALDEIMPCPSHNINTKDQKQDPSEIEHTTPCKIPNHPVMVLYQLEVIGLLGQCLAIILCLNVDGLKEKIIDWLGIEDKKSAHEREENETLNNNPNRFRASDGTNGYEDCNPNDFVLDELLANDTASCSDAYAPRRGGHYSRIQNNLLNIRRSESIASDVTVGELVNLTRKPSRISRRSLQASHNQNNAPQLFDSHRRSLSGLNNQNNMPQPLSLLTLAKDLDQVLQSIKTIMHYMELLGGRVDHIFKYLGISPPAHLMHPDHLIPPAQPSLGPMRPLGTPRVPEFEADFPFMHGMVDRDSEDGRVLRNPLLP